MIGPQLQGDFSDPWDTQWARKFKKSPGQKNLWNQINQFHEIFLTKIHYWHFQKWPKIYFWTGKKFEISEYFPWKYLQYIRDKIGLKMSIFFCIRLYLWPCSSTRCSVKSEAKPKPPSGIYHNLTVQSSEALAMMLSLKGFHLISNTGRLCPDTCKL